MEELKLNFNVEVKLIRKGEIVDRRILHNVVTTLGKEHVADQLAYTHDDDEIGWLAIGTGADAGTDPTELTTEAQRNILDHRTQGAGDDANTVEYEATFAAGEGTGLITEAGLLNSPNPASYGGGTLLCYAYFTALNKLITDSLIVTWTLSVD